jgi:hypothetical protein
VQWTLLEVWIYEADYLFGHVDIYR